MTLGRGGGRGTTPIGFSRKSVVIGDYALFLVEKYGANHQQVAMSLNIARTTLGRYLKRAKNRRAFRVAETRFKNGERQSI